VETVIVGRPPSTQYQLYLPIIIRWALITLLLIPSGDIGLKHKSPLENSVPTMGSSRQMGYQQQKQRQNRNLRPIFI
jgi:hypothetical protein